MDYKKIQQQSYQFGVNGHYIEELYAQYLEDSHSVDEQWKEWFDSLKEESSHVDQDHLAIQEKLKKVALARVENSATQSEADMHSLKQVSVLQLINAYRFRGHQIADLDPLKLRTKQQHPVELTLQSHHLNASDLDTVFHTGSLYGVEQATLREIIAILEKTYCGSIGSEYMYIADTDQKRWIQKYLESCLSVPSFKKGRRRRILERIIAAENLEKYLHTRYVGQKRFSLEGGEALIPVLDRVIQQAGKKGVREIVIGMAHRGRLNVLTNIFGKMPSNLFDEFEGKVEWNKKYNYDVKYHQGFSSDVNTVTGPMHIGLAFNPSHLEIVNPVVEGAVRARQFRSPGMSTECVVPVLVHGDAAFAGQGVVMETLNMYSTRGYRTGGTVHIIVNNQIGFTTSHPDDNRSTFYCTEIARMVQAPIFHVNGDDPEACVLVAELATNFRMKYKQDVVIDIICYRRYGHNEADEPSATQPMMYQAIRNHPRIVELHAAELVKQNVVTQKEVDAMVADYRRALEQGGGVALNVISGLEAKLQRQWHDFDDMALESSDKKATNLTLPQIQELGYKLLELPQGFLLHHRVKKIMDNRELMITEEVGCDWGCAENLAYASLLKQGFAIRISGQDSERGTFFHRHSVLHDQNTGKGFVPLKYIEENQPRFEVINSFLSEEAVLGFEYGYASTDPDTLVIWEAQFGDFANGAQVVIDQFISSGEVKWGRKNSLVMLLPHGYEGQGPEHSSARLERYLQLCAQNNMRVVMPTTPAQIYHLLRSQMHSNDRKPLIVMTPKSLLRLPAAVSPISLLSTGVFEKHLTETVDLDKSKVDRVIICTGKIYYKLMEVRQQKYSLNTAIIRAEQLYPFPLKELKQELSEYPNVKTVVWCQDEPKNQGAWLFVHSDLYHLAQGRPLIYAGREASASPAVGYMGFHNEQEHQLVTEAFESESLFNHSEELV
ncbi:MAG: 2-oxoglutarate dehydrogenase E1 component [Gammaproteobacteria bacterium]|nr:2-oxoglutarate dehydrogenase E1 component [Gammaproteobacteria bacterium]